MPEILELQSVPAQMVATQVSQGLFANADIIRFDTFPFLRDLVADPTRFGLPAGVNTTDPCFAGFVGDSGTTCKDPANRLFWD